MGEITTRPWGTYEILHETPFCKVKKITVLPGQRLSLQSHSERDEHWVVISGQGQIELDSGIDYQRLNAVHNGHFYIERGVKHRVSNKHAHADFVFIETQLGSGFDEADIVRYEDDYGRV